MAKCKSCGTSNADKNYLVCTVREVDDDLINTSSADENCLSIMKRVAIDLIDTSNVDENYIISTVRETNNDLIGTSSADENYFRKSMVKASNVLIDTSIVDENYLGKTRGGETGVNGHLSNEFDRKRKKRNGRENHGEEDTLGAEGKKATTPNYRYVGESSRSLRERVSEHLVNLKLWKKESFWLEH